ncbi:MAG: AHH domain-containing protein [Cetobacterium sp.]
MEKIKIIEFTKIESKEKKDSKKNDSDSNLNSNKNEENTTKKESKEKNNNNIKKEDRKFCNEYECERENKEKFESCGYRKRISNDVNNDSSILRSNLKSANNFEDDRDYKAIKMLNENEKHENVKCRIAAHHIISGKQIFQSLTEIVKLTQGVGYDINCFQNGIYLPTNEKNFGYEEGDVVSDKDKIFSAYDAMSLLGKQWHVGGHSYKIDKDIIEENIELKNFKNYAEKVKETVEKEFQVDKYKSVTRFAIKNCNMLKVA